MSILTGEGPLPVLWTRYRENMIDRAGIALFLFGNKLSEGNVVFSNGMREEYTIAKDRGLFLMPVGATGYMAEELWEEVNASIQSDSSISDEIKVQFAKLGDKSVALDNLIDAVVKILDVRKGE